MATSKQNDSLQPLNLWLSKNLLQYLIIFICISLAILSFSDLLWTFNDYRTAMHERYETYINHISKPLLIGDYTNLSQDTLTYFENIDSTEIGLIVQDKHNFSVAKYGKSINLSDFASLKSKSLLDDYFTKEIYDKTNRVIGVFYAKVSKFYLIYDSINRQLVLCLTIMAILIVYHYFIRRKLGEVTMPIVSLAEYIGSISDISNVSQFKIDAKFQELDILVRSLNELKTKIQLAEITKNENTKLTSSILIAHQVAHDIRSPLAALAAVTQGLSELPEDKRIMIRSAVQRIGDIANDLAGRGKQREAEAGTGETVQLLSGIIDALISEKRLQFRSRLEVNIQSTLENKSYGLFAKVEPAQFKRVLSNLVNNAVEAIADHGTVSIGMKQDRDGKIVISVSDTGAGIPPEILSKLTQKGATFGKKGGQGLGLFHARESVEAWGGEINLISEVGKGTTVTVSLPFECEPAWFVPELVVYPGTQIIILDDDESIHQIWKGRFEIKESGVALHHFSNGAALRDWYAQTQIHGPLLILCDYEILGSDETGLDVIKSLKLSEHTILVTSRFEEKNVREGCEQLGIRLLPKNLAGFVPIKFVEIPRDLEFVLIDDSRMNRTTWEIMARAKKRKVITFERPKDFYAVVERINKDAKFYVDLNLGDGVSGIDITREINNRGFENIFLYTGEDHVDTQDMPWIKGVVGKSLPFGREKTETID